MKKTAITLSVATLLMGGLIGCGPGNTVGNQALNNENMRDVNYGVARGYNTGYTALTDDPEGATPVEPGGTEDPAEPGGADPGEGEGEVEVGDETIPEGTVGDEETPIDSPVTDETEEGETEETGDEEGTPGEGTPEEGTPEAGTPEQEFQSSFKDVGRNNTHARDIEWAKDNNVITGHPDGSYRPSEAVTRAQIATIIRNVVEKGVLDRTETQ